MGGPLSDLAGKTVADPAIPRASVPFHNDHDWPTRPPGAPAPVSWEDVWACRSRVLRFARARVDHHEAEDVVEEAMVRAVSSGLVLPGPAVASWLLTTVRRLIVDRERERASQRRRALALASRRESLSADGPEEAVTDAAQAVWLAAQVEGLPGRQAEAVKLRAEGLSIEAVAGSMGLPAKAVESLLGRARRALRQVAA